MVLRIGVTEYKRLAVEPYKTKTDEYIAWLKSGECYGYNIECITLDYEDRGENQLQRTNREILPTLDAILFTGGQDIHPHFFGVDKTTEDLHSFHVTDCLLKRDEMELMLARESVSIKLPILGICRGLQLMNVALGGTLILDIEQQTKASSHKAIGPEESSYHPITIQQDTSLYKIIFTEDPTLKSVIVSSRHHQAADNIGKGLRAVSFSDDGIIEALEAVDDDHFILLVQWHPERMWIEGTDNSSSKNLLKGFLSTVAERKERLQQTINP